MPSPIPTIARHPDRAAIEQAIARGVSHAKIAKRYDLSRHVVSHYAARLRRENPKLMAVLAAQSWKITPEQLEQLRTETADGWLGQLRAAHARAVAHYDGLILKGKDQSAINAYAQVLKTLDMIGRAVGELGQHATQIQNNIVVNPGYWQARTAIIDALRPFPEARAAVLEALRRAEDEPAPVLDLEPGRTATPASFKPAPLPVPDDAP